MSQDRVVKTWRRHFVGKLQETYGLSEAEAHLRADLWLRWLKELPAMQLEPEAHANARNKRSSPLISAGSHARAARVF